MDKKQSNSNVNSLQVATMTEAAEMLRTNYCTLSRKVKNGEIPAFKIGSKILFRISTLEAWIAAQEKIGSPTPVPEQRGVLRRVNV